MKTSTIKQVAFAVLFAATYFPLILFGQVSHTVSFHSSDFSFGRKDTFDIIQARGYATTGDCPGCL